MDVLWLMFTLFFLASSVSSAEQSFPSCLATQSSNISNLSDFVYSPNATNYASILQSSLRNLRFNTSTTSKPQYIITPQSVSHVQTTVVCSKRVGLQVRVRSGGHDFEGLSYTSHLPFVVIDLVNLREVNIDVKNQTAWVQAGATIGELYYQVSTNSSTLGFPAGVWPSIGVGGHISGGGQGFLMRKYGLSADNVLDAVLVDSNGTVHNRESMGEDLFWAIRGGGGTSFGVIVSWKVKLVPVPPKVTVFSFSMDLDENGTRLVHKWQQLAPGLDKNLFIRLIIEMAYGSVAPIFQVFYLGTSEQLIPLLNASFPEFGLDASQCRNEYGWPCRELSWIESVVYFYDGLQEGEPIDILMQRGAFDKKYFFKAKSDFVDKPISERDLRSIWNVLLNGDREGCAMIWEPYGGRMSEITDTKTPFPHRAGTLFNIQYYSKWEDEKDASRRLNWTSNLYNFMGPFVTKNPRTAYLNYRDLDLGMSQDGNATYSEAKNWGDKYFKNNFERLARVKGKVDPANFFKNEQGVPPLVASVF